MTKRTIITYLIALIASITGTLAIAGPSVSAADTRWNYTNGCTLSPDGVPGFYNFRDICNRHDVCYARFSNGTHQYGTNEYGRSVCDGIFLGEMSRYCTDRFAWYDPRRGSCLGVANTYYSAVRAFGIPFYYDNNTRY